MERHWKSVHVGTFLLWQMCCHLSEEWYNGKTLKEFACRKRLPCDKCVVILVKNDTMERHWKSRHVGNISLWQMCWHSNALWKTLKEYACRKRSSCDICVVILVKNNTMEKHWKSVHIGNVFLVTIQCLHIGNVFLVTNVLSFLVQNDTMGRNWKNVHVRNVSPVTNALSFKCRMIQWKDTKKEKTIMWVLGWRLLLCKISFCFFFTEPCFA